MWEGVNSFFDNVMASPQDILQILSAGMITDKITIHINRKISSKDDSVEWKNVAEER